MATPSVERSLFKTFVLALCIAISCTASATARKTDHKPFNGRMVDIVNGFRKPRCGDFCIIKMVMATGPLDCGRKCAYLDGCRSAFYRISDGFCSMKKFNMGSRYMNTVVDKEKQHIGIRILGYNPNQSPSPKSPSPKSPSPRLSPPRLPPPKMSPPRSPPPKMSPPRSPRAPQGGLTGPTPSKAWCEDPEVKKSMEYHNNLRRTEGVPPLQCFEKLSKAAQDWSDYMCKTGVLSHGVEGTPTWVFTRLNKAGFSGWLGENVAYMTIQPNHGLLAAQMWEGSSGHRENMVRPEFTIIGLAYNVCAKDGRVYWTADFSSGV